MISPAVNQRRLAAVVALALGATFLFFAPHLWIMQHYVPGSTQWDRAHTFLLQCEQPFRRDIEPAMMWRLLPPVVCHLLHLPGKSPLLLPWLGIVVATAYVAVLFRRRLDDWRFVGGGTLLFTTTSAVLVPIGWLGMNDAWVWLGLLAVAFGRARWALPLACLLCPWIDERFVIGFPLAYLVRRCDRGETLAPLAWLTGAWLLPYAALRLWWSRQDAAANQAADAFLVYHLRQVALLLPFTPLGWWMGLRAAWAGVVYAVWSADRVPRFFLLAGLLGTGLISVVLAADLSRSIAILIPVVLLGCFTFAARHPLHAPRTLLVLGVVNLLLPAAHMTYTHFDPISPLPIELIRLFRSS